MQTQSTSHTAEPHSMATSVVAAPEGTAERVLAVFNQAARRVPAYRRILQEAGAPDRMTSLDEFLALVPLLNKKSTFGRFGIEELCLDGQLGMPLSVLTSSGHSGLFSYGVYGQAEGTRSADEIDDALDGAFAIRSRKTLLINCLPMGVKVVTRACTLAETSVRPDMVTAVAKHFGPSFEQILIIGEAAFVKRCLELGHEQGVEWGRMRVHVLVGEEPLAENARSYLYHLLEAEPPSGQVGQTTQCIVGSSMGLAELGLNLFSELPIGSGHAIDSLIRLRRALWADADLREAVLGPDNRIVPMVMTYDPRRLFVELRPGGEMVLTCLDIDRTVPMVRYDTGDRATPLRPSAELAARLARAAGVDERLFSEVPLLLIHGRGEGPMCEGRQVTPEQVKEALYAQAALAAATTANFRLWTQDGGVHVRIQLAPGQARSPELETQFAASIQRTTLVATAVQCVEHADFREGLETDYERKFSYLH